MTEDDFDKVMVLVSATWPAWKANRSTFGAGESMLMDLDYESAVRAVRELAVEEPRFAPGLGAIRAKAIASDAPDVDLAWQEVQQNIRKVGIKAVLYGAELHWSSSAIEQAVEAMGWRNLCESENEVADRAHFFQLYDRAARRVRREELLGLGASATPELTG